VITKSDRRFSLTFDDELGKAFRRVNVDRDGKCVLFWTFRFHLVYSFILVYANLGFHFRNSKFGFALRLSPYLKRMCICYCHQGVDWNVLRVRCDADSIPLNIACRFLKSEVLFENKVRWLRCKHVGNKDVYSIRVICASSYFMHSECFLQKDLGIFCVMHSYVTRQMWFNEVMLLPYLFLTSKEQLSKHTRV
jgi:hypothetical protein